MDEWGPFVTFKRSSLDAALEQSLQLLSEGKRDGKSEKDGLDEASLRSMEERFLGTFSREVPTDGLDLLAAGIAGAAASAVDLLLVALPRDVTYLGQHPQKGSVLTRLFKSWTAPSNNALAVSAKVPYDAISGADRVPGMYGGNHRFMTPGHDPILGLVVGVHDILRGGRTAIGTDGILRFDGGIVAPAANIAAALTTEFLHLLSDVATKAGLPAPLMTAAGLLRIGSFGEHKRTLADLARYMYLEGYDLRHFVTTCSAPAASRILLSAYFLGRRHLDRAYQDSTSASARRDASVLKHPKLERLTLYADAIACAANAGKIALYQGNPSAFNYGQWLAFLKSSATFLSTHLERPTELLLDRAAANEAALAKRWKAVREAVGLPFSVIDVDGAF
jgi:hypothetical protein